MSAIFPYSGKERTLGAVVAVLVEASRFCLFQNNIVPDENTVLGDLTEADFSGYLRTSTPWGATVPDAFGRATKPGDPVVFAHDGGVESNTIYGYYLVNEDLDTLLWVERFPAPRVMAALGDTISLAPVILDGNLAPP